MNKLKHQLKVDINNDDKRVMKIDQVKLTSKLLPCMIVCLYLMIEAIVCVQKTHTPMNYTQESFLLEFFAINCVRILRKSQMELFLST